MKCSDLTSLGIGVARLRTRKRRARGEGLLRQRYTFADDDQAQTLVALGGDGFMLHTLHRMLEDDARTCRCSG